MLYELKKNLLITNEKNIIPKICKRNFLEESYVQNSLEVRLDRRLDRFHLGIILLDGLSLASDLYE